ncbi:hypothetical protein KJ068_26325 [bacterium]|nr:hypothetical protein [bacterium]
MKQQILEQAEERFYFKTSHLFWHLLTGIGGLALIGGILVYIWGVTPSLKPGVAKPAYPSPIKVEASEIIQRLKPSELPSQVTAQTPTSYPATPEAPAQTQAVATIDSAAWAYQLAMDSLKALLPSNYYRWETAGHWEQQWFNRRWVVDAYGINDKLNAAYQKVNASGYTPVAQLLNAYIALVESYSVRQRLGALEAAIEISKDDVSTSVTNVQLLKATTSHFSTSDTDHLKALANFGRRNPRDGQSFIRYVNTIAPRFESVERKNMLGVMISSYYSHFNDIGRQQEATDLFLEMLPAFSATDQAKALGEYHQLFVQRNHERERQIQDLEAKYQSELSQAEATLAQKKAKKAMLRSMAWRVIAGSVAAIAFIALFLVLLSIQRNVRQMRELTIK